MTLNNPREPCYGFQWQFIWTVTGLNSICLVLAAQGLRNLTRRKVTFKTYPISFDPLRRSKALKASLRRLR